MKLKIHTTFRHDCSDWADEYTEYKVTRPTVFREGDEVDVPADAADYFIRAGWASEPDKEPVLPDPSKPVLVQPDSIKLAPKDTN